MLVISILLSKNQYITNESFLGDHYKLVNYTIYYNKLFVTTYNISSVKQKCKNINSNWFYLFIK